MPIANCPFTSFLPDQFPRPLLPIKIINPHTGKGFNTWGLIDSGADESAIPAINAKVLDTTNGGDKSQLQPVDALPQLIHTPPQLKFITVTTSVYSIQLTMF